MSMPKLNEAQSVYLDFLRALAAGMVLYGHAASLFMEKSWFLKFDFQTQAVMIFFLLSGFLISYSVFQKFSDPGYRFREYFIERFCRIYCAYLPALLIILCIDFYLIDLLGNVPERMATGPTWFTYFKSSYNPQTFVGNLLMLQDFPVFQILRRLNVPESPWFIRRFPGASPFWTVSIEWWIYMLFGMLVVIRLRQQNPFRWWQILVLAFVAIEPIYHFSAGSDQCLTMLWIIGMAACLGFLYPHDWLPRLHNMMSPIYSRKILWGLWMASLCLMPFRIYAIKLNQPVIKTAELQLGVYLAIAIFTGLMLLKNQPSVPVFIKRVIRFMAGYSYSLYLIHGAVICYIYLKFPGHDDDPPMFWLAVLAAHIAAIILWFLFERHYHVVAKWMKRKLPQSTT